MNKLVTFLLLFFAFVAKGEQTELFSNSWKIEKVIVNGNVHTVPNCMQQIQPVTLFTLDSFESIFCNILSANVSYSETRMTFISQSVTLGGCPPDPYGGDCGLFESVYFGQFFGGNLNTGFFKDYDYLIENEDNNTLKLTLTNPNGDKAFYQSPKLAVADISLNGIKMSPNPVNEILTVSIDDYGKKHSIKIVNAAGELVYHKIHSNSKVISIDTSGFSTGIYWISIKNGSKEQTFRILKR